MMRSGAEIAKMPTKEQRNMKSVRTTVSIHLEDYEKIERIAEKKKVSVARVVREAVDHYLTAESPMFRRSSDR